MSPRFLLASSLIALLLTWGEGVAALPKHETTNLDQEELVIEEGTPVPTVELIAHPDDVRGWNLELKITNFRFAPEQVNQKSNSQEGHAHLYINGEKVTRLYGTWYYLNQDLPPGRYEIEVVLSANGHETLVYQGNPIAAKTVIEVP